MASFDPALKVLQLRFLLCGPVRSGKSEVLARLRERVGDRLGDDAHDLKALPLSLQGGRATLELEVCELDPVDERNEATEALVRAADGVGFVADPRRERLRDNLMAYAWLLERLRGSGRTELPGVLLLNRRSGGDQVGATELESVIGSGRFPSFTVDALNGDEVARSMLELVRRGATRAHGEAKLDAHGLPLSLLLAALDDALARPAVVRAAVEPQEASIERGGAPARSPLGRYLRDLLAEQSSAARELRHVHEQASLIEEEARRPVQFLRSLFAHLERQGPRLPPTLEEAVAGGAEVVAHLEALLLRRVRPAGESAIEAAAKRGCDLARVAKQAARAAARELGGRPPLLDVDGSVGCAADADLLRALFFELFVAICRSRPMRRDARPRIRVRVDAEGRALRLRIGRFGRPSRGRGIEELALARRLARRLGWRFVFVPRRAGGIDLRLEPRELGVRIGAPLLALAPS